MSSLKVGMIQMTSGEDVQKNTLDLIENYKSITSNGQLDFVVSPENTLFMRLSKTTPMLSLKLDDPSILKLAEVVNQTGVPLILGSIPLWHSESTKFSNAMVLLRSGSPPEVIYEKIHLFDVDVVGHPPVRESEVFRSGAEGKIIEIGGFKIGLSICYDLRFSDLYLEYAKQGVDAILIPSAFLVPTGQAHWHVLIRARAIESQCYVIAPAQGGRSIRNDGEFRETYGHSLAVDPWGKVLIELDSENRTGIIELQRDNIIKVRTQIPMAKHRRLRS